MNASRSILLLSAACCALASAQVYTTPVGYEQITLTKSAFNYIGIRLHNTILAAGDMSATSATTVQDPGADFSALTGSSTFYVLEVLNANGYISEFTGSNVSGDIITIPDNLQSLGTFNYRIRAAATLASVFGAANSAGLKAGFYGPSGADIIYVPNGSGGFNRYYYDTGYASWRNAGNSTSVNGANVPLIYADGVIISASANAPASITVSGEVKTTPTSATLLAGFNYLCTVAPAGATLQTTFNTSQLAKGFYGPAGADMIYVPDGSGGFVKYYYDNGYAGWRNATTNTTLNPANGSGVSLTNSGLIVSTNSQKNITLGVPASYVP